ncbi:MAG: EAL domain-containing protein [Beijerinckiaceae bacterium]|jgi:diguanylate cyclase|nr:EAL domain-containing protein [Beijerinckiaceae bacterium]
MSFNANSSHRDVHDVRLFVRTAKRLTLVLVAAVTAGAWALASLEPAVESSRWAAFLAAGVASAAALFCGHLLACSVRGLALCEAHASALAGHDLLSGLPNRLLFTQLLDGEIARHRRHETKFALMYLDLDRFKDINDRYGHDAGDRMIIEMSRRIALSLRASDRFGRFGGDEFAILQTDISSPRDAEALAARIIEAMQAPFDLGQQQVFGNLSIGIAVCPDNTTEREDLMRLADLALYRAKNEGRNRYAFFEKKMGDELRRRKAYEDELALAIEAGDLRLDYQPIMSGDGLTLSGVEALVRWPHATRGIIPPDDFIGLAEQRGLIAPLGEWVLRRACQDALLWPGLRIAVNVSPIQFRRKEFVDIVRAILEETGLQPSRLELELTESVMVGDAEAAEANMKGLREMGVRLALDDFGTGYSSLIYLRRFALDKIKIDRSFVQTLEPDGESAIIIHSIVHLGRELGLTVTAEGVETLEHLRFLQALDCDELQGFYFSPPVNAQKIADMLAPPARAPALSAH